MKKRNRWLGLLFLAVILLLPAVSARADDSGQCGETLYWKDDGQTLTIYGTGDMWEPEEFPDGYPFWGFGEESISAIVIREGVTSVCDGAFSRLSSVESISIPKSLKRIGDEALTCSYKHYESALKSIMVDPANPYFCVEKGILYSKAKDILIKVPPHQKKAVYVIEKTVKTIKQGAFLLNDLTGVVIPGSVRTIEDRAFEDCWRLNWAVIPGSVSRIGEEAFCAADKWSTGPLIDIYYKGSVSGWKKAAGNRSLGNVSVHCNYSNPFTDVYPAVSYHDAVVWAYDHGIVKGKTSTVFAPSDGLTRGEFCTMLWRMWGKPSVSKTAERSFPFADAKKSNHYKAILWCYSKDIIKGYTVNGKQVFKPAKTITRSNILVMLYKLAQKERGFKKPTIGNPFTDVTDKNKNISAYKWAYQNKVLTSNTVNSAAACKRSAMVSFLYGYNNAYHRVR